MEISGGIEASLGGRYASALFQLARDDRQLQSVEDSLARVSQALSESSDFQRLTSNPVLSRKDASAGIAAVAGSLGLDPLTTRFLGVLAANRRLSQLPQVMRAFRTLAANHRGETTAEVTSAHPLDDGQVAELKQQLRQRVGRDVELHTHVDPSILGGLVVRIGSQMIDSSIRTRLNALAHAMKG